MKAAPAVAAAHASQSVRRSCQTRFGVVWVDSQTVNLRFTPEREHGRSGRPGPTPADVGATW